MSQGNGTVLTVQGVHKSFGNLHVLSGVNLDVASGGRHAVIGPNGAGKTTLFNIIGGELSPTAGKIKLQGKDVTHRPPHQRAIQGLGRTFQRNNVFLGLTVYENVGLAVQRHEGVHYRPLSPATRFPKVNARIDEILEQLGLSDRAQVPARNLSYGEQRQLEMAIALAARPTILLLDEPTAGMSPRETAEAVEIISRVPSDVAIVLIEHDMDVVMSLSERITVLHYGEVLAEGSPEEIKRNQVVKDTYLGEF
ncbi:MAG: ABC transporter ATP-binding protein [Firmicutes bacterium]|nr:ABC transporter ATP-binding protein [Bacillota bacterium]